MNFLHTKRLIKDIEEVIQNTKLELNHPLINQHLIKVGLLSFSSEMEDALKELIAKKLTGYTKFCQLCKKLKNPKFDDIKEILKELKIAKIDFLDDADKQKYSNTIALRDLVAHDPKNSNFNITFLDLKKTVEIAEKILKHIEEN